jgi:hypothetical protein
MSQGGATLSADMSLSLGAQGHQLKDAVLFEVGRQANVAQFVSFGPGAEPARRFSLVQGHDPGHQFNAVRESLAALLESAPEHAVNVRSFRPDQMKGGEFLYGLTTLDDVAAAVRRLAGSGAYTIVNETVDVEDGGVSGVSYGGIIEFAPGDTPRCVEQPGTVSIERRMGLRLLETVYSYAPDLSFPSNIRVEFSVHPVRRGYRRTHTIIWELEQTAPTQLEADLRWPNRFSRSIGDKAFGLLVADLVGLPVPATVVISRTIAPFRFGKPTGTAEPWFRTAPREQTPGLFTTTHGWVDPFQLVTKEDPQGADLASVLWQEGVDPVWSGALATSADGEVMIEGVPGRGDEFMQGKEAPQPLPESVERSVNDLQRKAAEALGPVRMEWVYDGTAAWVVQLHRGATEGSSRIIYPGSAASFHPFLVTEGIDALRRLISHLRNTEIGVVLIGDVGVTSHMGDLLRQARIPARLEPT